MTLLLPENGERYLAWTRKLSQFSEQPVEMLLAGLARREGDGRDSARESVVSSLEFLRWPARQMEYSYVLRALSGLAALRRVGSILDVGCGASPFPAVLAARFSARVTAIDRDAEIVETMERFGLPECAYRCSDMGVLPFPDGSFDAVTCVSVLEHVPRDQGVRAVGEMVRVVSPGGLVVLTLDYRARRAVDSLARLPGRVRKAVRLFLSAGAAAVAHSASAPKPYDWKDLEDLRVRFGDSVIGRPDARWAHLGRKKVREFWTDHWQTAFRYDRKKGRDYTSVGVLVSRDAGVREALHDLQPEET